MGNGVNIRPCRLGEAPDCYSVIEYTSMSLSCGGGFDEQYDEKSSSSSSFSKQAGSEYPDDQYDDDAIELA